MARGKIENIADIKRFIFAGNATFTIVNNNSGNRFTYKVVKKEKKEGNGFIWFVNLLSGTNNDSNYSRLCFMYGNNNGFSIRNKDYKISQKATSYLAFEWLINKTNNMQEIPSYVDFYHENKCCKCGKKLTVPESIKNGIGPECSKSFNL